MNGPVVLLIAVLIVVPLMILLLRLDAWMTEREYQRRIAGDESERFARARARIQAQQSNHPSRLGHKPPGRGDNE